MICTMSTMAMEKTVTDAVTKGANEKYCRDCGALISIKAEICPKCGVRQMAAPGSINLGPTAPNGRNRLVAALLALFLGGLGAHKFYLGQTGKGILYLLFFWTCIPAILGFIEFILLLAMSDEAFSQQYGG